VLPAEPAYSALLKAFGDRVEAVAKDLEVYATDEPPASYGLELEGRGSFVRRTRTDSTASTSSATRAVAQRVSPSPRRREIGC
jgi:hypothetical protein